MHALLLVDHGSRRAASNTQLDDMAMRVRRLRPGDLVAAAHMEIASPSITEAVAAPVAAGATRLTVLCYFLSDGRHVGEDVPRLVAEACAPHALPSTIGAALGPHDTLAALLLERAGLPASDPGVRTGP